MAFIIDAYHMIPIRPQLSMNNMAFAIISRIDGRDIQFSFSWNSKYKYYSMDLIDPSNTTLAKVYPEANETHLIENFNPLSRTAPDAKVGIFDGNRTEERITPETIFQKQSIVVMTGKEDRSL